MAKIMKQQDCIANFCASSQPHRRSPRSHPTASESSPFICILSNFLSSVLVLIVIIGLQWFLTTTVNTGNTGTTVAFAGLKYQRLPPWNTVQNKRGNPPVHSGEPQASRWFIYQQFFCFTPGFLDVLICHPSLFTAMQFDALYRITVQICLLEKVKACGLWHLPEETAELNQWKVMQCF